MHDVIIPRNTIGRLSLRTDMKGDINVDVKCNKCSWTNVHTREYDATLDLQAHFEHAHKYPIPLLQEVPE